MKELTKKILESGLVDKTTAKLMEKWGQLEEGSSELVDHHALTRKTLEDFIEDIELLLQPEAIEKKEVQLDPLLGEVYDPEKGM